MSHENVEIVRRLYERWAVGDLTADYFDPAIEFCRIGATTPDLEGTWKGREEVLTVMRGYLHPFSDLRIEAERIIDLGEDRVLVLSRQTGRGKQSLAPIEHAFGELFTVRGSRIVRYESYWDRAKAFEAAGISE
jgi:ketosteroid isomerase-like protein